jgi:hypothetical protein
MLRSLLAFVASSCLAVVSVQGADKLAVHEWGTFTSLEDENGNPIGGINTDDEPVPVFVHDLDRLIAGPSEIPRMLFSKGLPSADPDPDVRVRLETPVIYFHLPAHESKPIKLDVDVTFHGGWLTQYYPDAAASAPGITDPKGRLGKLDEKTDGTLAWHGLTIGADHPGPATTAQVWLAPRAVSAASVTTAKNESERFLFYRGVGNILPPLHVRRSTDGALLTIAADSPDMLKSLWLLDVKSDGRAAMRLLANSPAHPHNQLLSPATFAEADYKSDNVAKLRQSLREAIMQEGLFADEADALLNTWETSYFRRPGLRLFFMAPTGWTDRVLPLHLSVDADVKRVMVGRIEIVTLQDRMLLAAIARGPASNPNTWLADALKKAGGGREDYYKQEGYQRCLFSVLPHRRDSLSL